ncbi:MAG: phosphoglycerate dehydrogenase [Spirochaetaceae bacterium]|jgi:D-3-phosphoglycerate dehydrogenase|nr:phosphoglycerate dehydrogenase [Spirochaetaceae bacterium]
MFRIQTMNNISQEGLSLFPKDSYEVANEISNPDAILVRSADLHNIKIPESVLAIVRAGAGVNNIPVEMCSERGIAVFNTPGANANAVKELVLASLFLSSRKITDAISWCKTLSLNSEDGAKLIEKGKSNFIGPEIRGKTLGIIGLGAVGVMVANDASALGMEVIGHDPYISVDSAWNLSRTVKNAESIDEIMSKSDYISIHVPYSEKTKDILNAGKIKIMKRGARLINLARGGLAKEGDIISALDRGQLSVYITDFPTEELIAHNKVICIPHLGASTPEAEINCAVMAVKEVMDFLETGNIKNSVNFPRCSLNKYSPYRLLVTNKNIPNMVGQITTLLAGMKINITDLINHHQGEYAYNIIDTEQKMPQDIINNLKNIPGIIRVRTIE